MKKLIFALAALSAVTTCAGGSNLRYSIQVNKPAK